MAKYEYVVKKYSVGTNSESFRLMVYKDGIFYKNSDTYYISQYIVNEIVDRFVDDEDLTTMTPVPDGVSYDVAPTPTNSVNIAAENASVVVTGTTITPSTTITNEKEITKEEYDDIKNKELADCNLDVYENVDNQQDADDIISSMSSDYIDEDLMNEQDDDELSYGYDPNANYVFTSPDDSLYVDKSSAIANTTTKSSSPESKSGPSYSGGGVPTTCSDIAKNFNKNLKISKYYTLGNVAVYFDRLVNKTATVKRKGVKVSQNFTKEQLACNLKALAVNILDKIKDQYPDMEINSTIRNWGTCSEHETGQAADLRFTKHKKKDYIKIAEWIHSNCPYNQLFLEYKPKDNPRGGWIHVSYTQPGNLVYGADKAKSTLYNDSPTSPGASGRFVNVMANSDWT